MLEALKRLVGMDKESAEARKKAAELERQERESRIAKSKQELEQVAKAEKEDR